MYDDVLPFPFVPPTCIRFRLSMGKSRVDKNFTTFFRPGLYAFFPIA